MTNTEKSTYTPISKALGITSSERYLKRLCEHTFLSLWSYPSIYRDQGGGGKNKGEGKEICDLIVVFSPHIIIFSDKDCKFPNSGEIRVDWNRWFRKSVKEAAEQIYGAERWLKLHPDRIFLDRSCTHPFPLTLPSARQLKIHRVVVARGASSKCKSLLGGSGSLMIDSTLVGEDHFKSDNPPFTVGQVDPSKGYVHVFDDTSLDIVMNTLDTISDFVSYLEKKERFLTGKTAVFATGEEDLLGYYLGKLNSRGEHDFVFPRDINAIVITEGEWDHFQHSPEHQKQLQANEISYAWDRLIETFNKHLMEGSQYFTPQRPISELELAHRFLASEPRTTRRALAKKLIDLIATAPKNNYIARVIRPSNDKHPYYVFIATPPPNKTPLKSLEEYRQARLHLLYAYCMVLKLRYPKAKDVVGIATESGIDNKHRSEDLIYLNLREWKKEHKLEARELQRELNILNRKRRPEFHFTEYEYPTNIDSSWADYKQDKIPRNSRCPCGSGLKYKYCHGKQLDS